MKSNLSRDFMSVLHLIHMADTKPWIPSCSVHWTEVGVGLTRFVTNRGGTFDVEVDGTLIYSKALTGRHANPGEVLGLFRDFVGAETAVYER